MGRKVVNNPQVFVITIHRLISEREKNVNPHSFLRGNLLYYWQLGILYELYSKTPLVYSAEKSRRVENRSTQKNIRDNGVTKNSYSWGVIQITLNHAFPNQKFRNYSFNLSDRVILQDSFLPDWSWNFVIGQTMLWTAKYLVKYLNATPEHLLSNC